MYLEIEENPNCEATPLQLFEALSPPKAVQKMWLEREGKKVLCWVAGIEKGGVPSPAYAVKVSDSGSGSSLLIYGGNWGIRFKPVPFEEEPWDLQNPHQWGEPYKFYGSESDLVYAE